MENNNKIRELYSVYLELGHEVFEEKIKKPMELYLHANRNVISMNSLDTIIANAMETSKLGEASFYENDLFSPPTFEDSTSRKQAIRSYPLTALVPVAPRTGTNAGTRPG